MSTLINTAVSAIVDALGGAPAVCADIERVRLRPVSSGVSLAVAVRPVASEVLQTNLNPGMPLSWNTTVAVECYAKSGADVAADVAVDDLLADTYARLMSDPTLGGLVVNLRPKGVSYDFDADGQQTTCATLVLEILQRTAGNSLS